MRRFFLFYPGVLLKCVTSDGGTYFCCSDYSGTHFHCPAPRCDFASQSSTRKSTWQHVRKTHHAQIKTCICGFEFLQKSDLTRHIKGSTDGEHDEEDEEEDEEEEEEVQVCVLNSLRSIDILFSLTAGSTQSYERFQNESKRGTEKVRRGQEIQRQGRSTPI